MREEQKREADRVQQERATEFKRSLEANHAEVFERPPPPKEKTKGLLCQMVFASLFVFVCAFQDARAFLGADLQARAASAKQWTISLMMRHVHPPSAPQSAVGLRPLPPQSRPIAPAQTPPR